MFDDTLRIGDAVVGNASGYVYTYVAEFSKDFIVISNSHATINVHVQFFKKAKTIMFFEWLQDRAEKFNKKMQKFFSPNNLK